MSTSVKDYEFGRDEGFTGYRFDLENQSKIFSDGMDSYFAWRKTFEDEYQWEPPKEIDPRQWTVTDNQKSMGSCQGNALANLAERLHAIETGEVLQLSRAFAYLSSQEYDGLLGRDSGSTLAGGTKAIKRGIPTEQVFPYSDNYRSVLSSYRSNKSSILSTPETLYKCDGATPLTTEDDCFRFLSSWSGAIEIGIMWGLPNAWEITSYRAGGGGHAVLLSGYLKVDSWQPYGYGYLLHNSWGEGWGRDGWALVHPQAIKQMLQARFTVFVGRSGPRTPVPVPTPDI